MATEKLLNDLEARQKKRELNFWEAARKLASGQDVPTATVEKLLSELDKTAKDLAAAVELVRQRREWHKLVKGLPRLERQRSEIEKTIADADSAFEQAERKYDETVGSLHAELASLRTTQRKATEARRQLIHTCPNEDLQAELADISKALSQARDRANELRKEAERIRAAETDEREAEMEGDTAKGERWRASAKQNRRAAEKATAELPAAEKQIADLERREADIHRRMAAAWV